MSGCPDIGLDGASVSSALASVDCHVDAAVAMSYGRLFGSAGAPLSAALTVMLTLYVAVIGLRLMSGRGGALAELSSKVAILGVVLTFATAWPAYQTIVYNLLVHGPDQIAGLLVGGSEPAAVGFAGRLDGDLSRVTAAATALTPAKEQLATPAGINGGLLWLSALMFLLASVGVLVAAKLVLGVLLALGPVFVVLALFPATRGLFEGWLRVSAGFAFAPMFAVLSGSAALLFLEPAISALPEQPGAQTGPSGPVVMLFVGAIIYSLLVVMTWAAAGRLVAGWRPNGREGVRQSAARSALSVAQASTLAASPLVTAVSGERAAASMVTGIERRDRETQRLEVRTSAPSMSAPGGAVRGLGQAFASVP